MAEVEEHGFEERWNRNKINSIKNNQTSNHSAHPASSSNTILKPGLGHEF